MNIHYRLLLEPFNLKLDYVKRLTWKQAYKLYIKPSADNAKVVQSGRAIPMNGPEVEEDRPMPSRQEFYAGCRAANPELSDEKLAEMYSMVTMNWNSE